MNTGDKLSNSGFDTSRYDTIAKKWIAGCSKCNVINNNGTPAHELDCANRQKVKARQNKGKANRLRSERK